MAEIKDGCMCMPGRQKDAISHSLGLEIVDKQKLMRIVEMESLKKTIKDEISELQKIKKDIDDLEYC